MKNPKIKKLVITIVTLLGLFFGYKVIETPPVNFLNKVSKTDSVKIDSIKVDTLK